MVVGSSPKSLNTVACHVLASKRALWVHSRSFLTYVHNPSRHNLDTTFKRERRSADGQCIDVCRVILRDWIRYGKRSCLSPYCVSPPIRLTPQYIPPPNAPDNNIPALVERTTNAHLTEPSKKQAQRISKMPLCIPVNSIVDPFSIRMIG